MSLNSWRKRRVLTGMVHITNNPWTFFCVSVFCPECLDEWFWTNTVSNQGANDQDCIWLAGAWSRCLDFAQRDLKSSPKSIFLLLSIIKDMVSISEKGRMFSHGNSWGSVNEGVVVGMMMFSMPSSSWQLSGEGSNAGCGEQDFWNSASPQAHLSKGC